MKKTISEIANNPLNIRANNLVWRGQCGEYKGFVSFTNDLYGYRAAIKILLGYLGSGLQTPEQIIRRWAPPTENDCEAYVKAVCGGHSSLTPTSSVLGTRQFKELVYMMTLHERGKAGDFTLINSAFDMVKKGALSREQRDGLNFLTDYELERYV